MNRVVITGMGVVAPNGVGLEAFNNAIKSGASGITFHQNLADFNFSLPFNNLPNNKKIGYEPWHISYIPLAQHYQKQLNPEILLTAWQNEPLQGKEILEQNINEIFYHYIL